MTLIDTLLEFIDALNLLRRPGDEGIGETLARSPQGHPAREIASRVWKCEGCGGLGPLTKLSWPVGDDGNVEDPVCPYCSKPDLVMYSRPVAGHA